MLAVLAAATLLGGGAWAEAGGKQVPPDETLVQLLERADRAGLDRDPAWLALLHYDTGWLHWRPRGRAATPGFFLSPIGSRDPRAELHATLRAFFDPTNVVRDGQHAQCAFVARREWLMRRLGVDDAQLPSVRCDPYERWRTGLDAQGLTLIFPEGFMGNPVSMFGHTLLRLDVTRDASPEDLLGHAIDFTANSGDDAALVYVTRGVFGRYPGRFLLHPYYEQLKRYADWENRDVWEYRLAVGPEEIDLLLMHLWEVQGIEFPYWFFTKNCSYELLRLLEVGVTDLDASRRFPGAVLPIDTVRAVTTRPGLVRATRYRPSPETTLRATLRSLEPRDRRRVEAIVAGRLDSGDEALAALPPLRRARVLDAAYASLRYQYLAGRLTDAASRSLSREILLARSRVRGPNAAPPTEAAVPRPPVRPDQGHASSLAAVGAGWRDDEAFVEIRLRPAFHDLLDDDGGYPSHMAIRVLDTRLRIYPEPGRVWLQELTLLELESLRPRSYVAQPWAWRLGTGLATRRVPDGRALDDAAVWRTQGGAGLAWDPRPDLLLYGLAEGVLDVGPALEDDVSVGPGARVGVFAGRHGGPLKAHAFGRVTGFVLGDETTWLEGGLAWRLTTSRNSALVAEGTVNRLYDETWLEGALRVNFYF